MLVSPDGTGLVTLAETNSSDFTTGVSFSRDGTLVAYSAYKGSDPDVYVIPARGGRAKQVTFSRGIDVDPAWAPLGTIAFERGTAAAISPTRPGPRPAAASASSSRPYVERGDP
jgi:Tol biopolymer transport system component